MRDSLGAWRCLRRVWDEAAEAGTPAASLPERHQLAPQDTWALEALYATEAAWEEEARRLQAQLPELERYRGRLAEAAETLYACLQLRDRLLQTYERLATYAHLRRDEDTRRPEGQALAARADRLGTEVKRAMAFIEPELLAMSPETLAGFLHDYPPLALYRFHIDDVIRRRPHTLSPAEEELLARTSDLAQVPYLAFSMLNNADLTFPRIADEQGREVEVTKGRYYRLLESPDRRVRHDAFHAFFSTYERYKNTWAAMLQGAIHRDVFYARVRKYPSALARALDADNIPVAVFTTLLETVNAHLAPLHRYVRLRQRCLQLDAVHPYDLACPLGPQVQPTFTYAEARRLVREAMQPLGPEYTAVLARALDERWIDVYETAGKRAGAYSTGAYGVHPFILMNFNGTLRDVFTLAHELGHALHTYFTNQSQPFVYSDYPIFVAEVASTTSEALLMHHLLATTRETARRLVLLQYALEQFRTTFYNQVLFADFEWQVHQQVEAGGALTHAWLGERFAELFQKYYGEALVQDAVHRVGWARIPHFYYNFYVYQYATGFAAATALAQQILEEGEPAVARYLAFLRGGRAKYPLELLREAGVDMTQPEPLLRTIRRFAALVDELAALLAPP
ncbi:MAG: oligoendopeptidase F [Candidatus Tectimicrobiota bacterium]|nr:MAG: oligoendopeptidase F [Candidatus Tectomicrobia bacterium]